MDVYEKCSVIFPHYVLRVFCLNQSCSQCKNYRPTRFVICKRNNSSENKKAAQKAAFAVTTRLELATSGVTGRHSNQLNYATIIFYLNELPLCSCCRFKRRCKYILSFFSCNTKNKNFRKNVYRADNQLFEMFSCSR